MAYYKKGNKEAHIGGYLFQPDCNTVDAWDQLQL